MYKYEIFYCFIFYIWSLAFLTGVLMIFLTYVENHCKCTENTLLSVDVWRIFLHIMPKFTKNLYGCLEYSSVTTYTLSKRMIIILLFFHKRLFATWWWWYWRVVKSLWSHEMIISASRLLVSRCGDVQVPALAFPLELRVIFCKNTNGQ